MRYQPDNPRSCAACPTVITGHANKKFCAPCRDARRRQIHSEVMKRHKQKRQAYYRAWLLNRKYGLTVEEHNAMLSAGCEACGTREGKLCVDHDHQTGEVRGLLCDPCNRALGTLKDDPVRVMGLLEYIARRVS